MEKVQSCSLERKILLQVFEPPRLINNIVLEIDPESPISFKEVKKALGKVGVSFSYEEIVRYQYVGKRELKGYVDTIGSKNNFIFNPSYRRIEIELSEPKDEILVEKHLEKELTKVLRSNEKYKIHLF